MTIAEEKQALKRQVEELLAKEYIQAHELTAKRLVELKSDMDGDFFTVVVLGEFKRGKSTFINAMLGRSLLPVDVLPETATINALIYNDEPVVQVVMNDGTERNGELSREFLEQFSARRENSDTQNVKYIKIGYPANILRNRTVIVDTPGVSDINEQRCEVTYRFIPKANAVIFLLDANSPLKKTEKDFIDEKLLPLGIDNILFVVNKYDQVDEEEEGEDFLEELQYRLATAFEIGTDKAALSQIRLYPLSATMALKGRASGNNAYVELSGIREIEAAIGEVVYGGRVEQDKLRRYKGRMKEALQLLYRELASQKAMQEADVEVLRQAEHQLNELLAEQEGNQHNIKTYASAQKEHIIAMVNKSLQYFHQRMEENIVDMVQGYHGMDFKSFVEQRVSKCMQREMEGWVAAYSPHVDQLLKALERELVKGISYRFRQKVQINTDGVGHFRQERAIFDITAQDVSDANMKAGLITAGGAGLMMLIGGPVLLPFISMAAFPFLQKKMLDSKLAAAKDIAVPAIQEQIAQAVYNLQIALHTHINEKCDHIVKNTEYVYETILEDMKQRIQTHIQAKETEKRDITRSVQMLDTNMNDIMNTINKW